MTEDLARWRSEIDRLDDQIIDLLARRFEVCREVAAFKRPRGIAVRLPDRIAEVRNRCIERAARHGIRAAFAAALYDLIIEETCRTEEVAIAAAETTEPPPG